jgi:peptide deformylase
MALLPIKIHPDPVLRVKCATVETFDGELKRLAEDMIQTMNAAPGVGLAACQVGREIRLAIVDPSAGEDPSALHVLINPEIVEDRGRAIDDEGCLSIPGITEKVARPTYVKIEAQDLDGETFVLEGEELMARVICHEVDHLNGVLFIDRLSGLRKERVKRKMKRLARDQEAVG